MAPPSNRHMLDFPFPFHRAHRSEDRRSMNVEPIGVEEKGGRGTIARYSRQKLIKGDWFTGSVSRDLYRAVLLDTVELCDRAVHGSASRAHTPTSGDKQPRDSSLRDSNLRDSNLRDSNLDTAWKAPKRLFVWLWLPWAPQNTEKRSDWPRTVR